MKNKPRNVLSFPTALLILLAALLLAVDTTAPTVPVEMVIQAETEYVSVLLTAAEVPQEDTVRP